MKIEAVVLDLGNVVLDLSPQLTLQALGRKDIPMRFSQWPVYMEYESGNTNTETFLSQLKEAFQLDWTRDEIVRVWNLMLPGLLPGLAEVLAACKQPLYALSNTNPLHLEHFKTMDELKNFREIFTSFSWKTRKPSPDIFRRLIQELALDPKQILFVDDLEENVSAARAVGIQAHRCYRSSSDLLSLLKQHGK